MTRGKGIYDDEDGTHTSSASAQNRVESDGDIDEKTPDVDKGSEEPTA
ncbi:hypothetical protein [Mycobacterium sp. SMC-4]|nr:hypothetical protein [Mycobacterium sp. SMC-4]UXA17701.1 hypothetical protein KXD98_23865 [Mycobacterium sp. SMC-4]